MNEKSLKLLEQYDLELISARRGRGSYICETSLGKKLLTDYTGSEKKIVFTNQLLERMEQLWPAGKAPICAGTGMTIPVC